MIFLPLPSAMLCFVLHLTPPTPTPQMQKHSMLTFTRDTLGSQILSQHHPEELTVIKIDKSTALIHGLRYSGKQFLWIIIISAGHFWSQSLEVIFQDKQSQLPF